ncbi:hypothetical protein [Geopseudomonas aromaticivorans]
MKRSLMRALAEAFDRAARDRFEAPQAAAAYGEPEPTVWESWVFWCRGFAAGLVGDWRSLPLGERLRAWALRRKASKGSAR